MVRAAMPLLPWFGQRLPVYRGPYKQRGRDLVVVETPQGIHRAIPVEWTDWLPIAQCPVLDSQPVLFEAERLLALADWVDAANADNLTYQDKKEGYFVDEDKPPKDRAHAKRAHGRRTRCCTTAARRGGRLRGCARSISARSGDTVDCPDDREADTKSWGPRDQ